MLIASFNVRSLVGNDRLMEIEEAISDSKIDIIGLSEIKRLGNQIIRTKNDNLFCYKGEVAGQRGIGFIISKKWVENVVEFEGVNDRIAILRLNLPKNNSLTLIQTYAPTTMSSENEIDNFYNALVSCTQNIKTNKKHQLIVMGDFNSQIGKRENEEGEVMGPYTYGQRNERGQKLIRFCQSMSLKIVNTFFKKRYGRRWTWISPNAIYKNQIDYMLVPSQSNFIKNFDVLQSFRFQSDHRVLTCSFPLKGWRYTSNNEKNIKNEANISITNSNIYKKNLNELTINFEFPKNRPIDEIYKKLKDLIFAASKKTTDSTREPKNKDPPKAGIPNNIITLIKQRESLKRRKNKTDIEKIELNLMCKLIKQKLRIYNKEKNNECIKNILETTKSTKTIRKSLSLGNQLITYLWDEDDQKIYSRIGINETATKFYKNLYHEESSRFQGTELGEMEVETVPECIPAEIEQIVLKLKNGKAIGSDKIANEQLKYASNSLLKIITGLYNEILQSKKTPTEWDLSDIILIHKKGDKHKIGNYRPISLTSNLSKVFSKFLGQRISKIIDFQQPPEQAGFRRGFSTIDHLHTVNQLIEKSQEYNFDLHLAFIDYSKAFDSLDHNYMIKALKNQGIPATYIIIIKNMYTNLKARIKTDKLGTYFNIEKGVKQGDPLSSFIFICTLEEVFRGLEWDGKGLKINGKYLNNLRFADDIVLIAKNENELQTMMTELNEKSKIAGLSINFDKTKILSRSKKINFNFNLNNINIEIVNKFVYLGQLIMFENRTKTEINRRIALTWKKYWSLKSVFKGPFSNSLKSHIFNSCVVPVLTYGSQTWSLTQNDLKLINTTQNSLERSMLNVRKLDRIKIATIKKKFKTNVNIVHEIRRKKWDWAGHIYRLREFRWNQATTTWYLKEGRTKGRQKTRWSDDFTLFLRNKQFSRVAFDRLEWRRLREAFAQNMGLH